MKTYLIAFLTTTLVLFSSLCFVYAGEVTIPNEFTAGERAVAAEVNANFDAVETGVNDNDSRIAVLEAAINTMQTRINDLEDENTSLQDENDALSARLSAVEGNSVLDLDNVLTMDTDDSGYDRALFTGVNVQVVNGSDSTDGAVDGTGNLIVGYNELRGFGDNKTGSHNIVGGIENNYSSYGGFVVGSTNDITGIYSSVIAGWDNTASGVSSSVSGGGGNTASGVFSSVSGGYNNDANGSYSSVSGGANGTAAGTDDWVAGTLWEDE